MSDETGITAKKEENISEWYTQVIRKAELIEYTEVSGCMVLRPYAFKIWEELKDYLDKEIKERDVENAYFPLLIPEHLLNKESEHVEGFNPEVAWVTHSGDEELNENLAIRPTSETIIYDSFNKWIRSHKDLPLKINQWCNVVRWEFKHPTPFLRTREFLWQEGHTAYANKQDADDEVLDIIKLYKQTFEEKLAVPTLLGKKSENEKFAGADYTLSLETFLPEGKAIQACTSHALGQNFSKNFDITFQDENEEKQHVWQNSWGFTTRSIGIAIMMHGDDKGLVLPPKVAPKQMVIVPILFSDKEEQNKEVLKECEMVKEYLGDWRVHLDDRTDKTPGWKFNYWELKGVPLRIEIGPRDIEDEQVVAVRRDNGEKTEIPLDELEETVEDLLEDVQNNLYAQASQFLNDSIITVDNMEDLKQAVNNGYIAKAPWGGNPEDEEHFKNETDGAKTLNISLDEEVDDEECVFTSKPAKGWCYFAKSR